MKKAILIILFLTIVILPTDAFEGGEKILDFVQKTITAPTVTFQTFDNALIYEKLKNTEGGITIENAGKNGGDSYLLLESQKKYFSAGSSMYVGTAYKIDKIGKIDSQLALGIGLQSQNISFFRQDSNGYGGSLGFTADSTVSVKHNSDILINLMVALKDFRYVFLTAGFRHVSYNVEISGTRWLYTSAYPTAALARANLSGERFNISQTGSFGVFEPGIAFGLTDAANSQSRSRIIVGVKFPNLNFAATTGHISITYDISNTPEKDSKTTAIQPE